MNAAFWTGAVSCRVNAAFRERGDHFYAPVYPCMAGESPRQGQVSPLLTLPGRVGMAARLSLGSVVRRGYRSPTMPRYFASSTSSSATVAYGCPLCSLKATNFR